MKKSIFIAFLLPLLFTLTFFSCKTTPPPEEPAPEQPAVVSQPEPAPAPKPVYADELKDYLIQAEEARKRAIDFESPAYFPSDWEAVEAQYSSAIKKEVDTEDDLKDATALLISITSTYDSIFNKTIPLYAQAREDEILAVRDELIGTGLTPIFPEYLEKGDTLALTSLDQYEAKDYYTARDTASAALNEYELLLAGANTYLKRQEIVDRGFVRYDWENFSKADEVAVGAVEKYEAGDKAGARAGADEAILRYNAVLSNSWTAYAADRKASASDEREKALANKVNIASRESFRQADAVFSQAEENLNASNYESAASLYSDSEALFLLAGQETEEKRIRAVDTIRIAEEQFERTIETAIEAVRIFEEGGIR